jgi:hypothetical protein
MAKGKGQLEIARKTICHLLFAICPLLFLFLPTAYGLLQTIAITVRLPRVASRARVGINLDVGASILFAALGS